MSMERVKELLIDIENDDIEIDLASNEIIDLFKQKDRRIIKLYRENKEKYHRIEEMEKVLRLAIKCNGESKKVELHTILEQALNK